jgi:hypothetical protein
LPLEVRPGCFQGISKRLCKKYFAGLILNKVSVRSEKCFFDIKIWFLYPTPISHLSRSTDWSIAVLILFWDHFNVFTFNNYLQHWSSSFHTFIS